MQAMRGGVSIASTLVALAAVGPASGDLVKLPAAADNTLYESDIGELGNGSGTHFFAGTTASGLIRRGLVRFDVASAVPAGSVITSVSLTLHMSMTNAAAELIDLHRVLADWGEGPTVGFGEEGGGAPVQPGDATWIHTFFDYETPLYWSAAGGDFDLRISGTQVVVGNGYYTWGSTPQMVADVQQWLDAPSTSHGWLLRGNEALATTTKRFDSRENPVEAVRPSLTIEYVPIPEPGGTMAAALLLALARVRRR